MADAVAIRELFPVKVVPDVLGVARSNLIAQRQGATRSRGSYRRFDQGEAVVRRL